MGGSAAAAVGSAFACTESAAAYVGCVAAGSVSGVVETQAECCVDLKEILALLWFHLSCACGTPEV